MCSTQGNSQYSSAGKRNSKYNPTCRQLVYAARVDNSRVKHADRFIGHVEKAGYDAESSFHVSR
jgi:hypothetical protein